MRSNTYFELVFFKHEWENAILYFDDGKHILHTGDIVLLPPNVKYRFECFGINQAIIIGFNECAYSFENAPLIIREDSKQSVTKVLDMMWDEFSDRRFKRRQMLNALLNSAIIQIIRQAQAYDDKRDLEADNFDFILQFMKAHSHNGFDIAEFSKMSGLSYHRFRHKFKEITKISPQQFIIQQRLNFAKNLLVSTKYSTSAIAIACGFHSIPQFITCFSKQEGVTPVKYRKIHSADSAVGTICPKDNCTGS